MKAVVGSLTLKCTQCIFLYAIESKLRKLALLYLCVCVHA